MGERMVVMGNGKSESVYIYQMHSIVLIFNIVLVLELVEVRTPKPRRHAGKGCLMRGIAAVTKQEP